ncbi:MAG: peptidyl-prolyl cis-trans isomerase [Pseudomonadota bacterium]
MQKFSKTAVVLLVGALFSAPLFAATANKAAAFAKVNGVVITESVANAFIAEQKAQGIPDSPELKNAVREELIRRELLAQEAKKMGLNKKANIVAQADLARQVIFIRSFVQEYIKSHPISDERLKNDYEKLKTQFSGTEYKTRHILVADEEEAKAIIEELKKGAKLEELAKQKSKDPGSKENGGDLGWNSATNYVKPFGEALTQLEKGKYTETPVKTEFGYHVIFLEDSRPMSAPPFETVKAQLSQRAQQQQVETLVNNLRAKAKVE